MRYQKNLTHLKTLPVVQMWGLQTIARRARRFVLQKRGISWHHIGYFQLYASFRHIRTMCKSCSDIQAKEISFSPFCMDNFRKAAYRQLALGRHMLNRNVMPFCVELQIRHSYWFALSIRLFMPFEFLITLAPTPLLFVTREKRSRDWLFNRRLIVM